MSTAENNITATTNASEVTAATPEVEAPKAIVDPETTVFIGNISRDCTEEDLNDVFSGEFGSVEVEIPSTKSKKGKLFKQRYAFVKFPSKIDFEAIKAKYDKTVIKERGIYIRRALTEEERDANRKARAEKKKERLLQNAELKKVAKKVAKDKTGEETSVEAKAESENTDATKDGNGDKKFTRSKAVPAPPRREKVPLESMQRSTDTLYVNNVPYFATKEELAEFFGTKPELVVLPLRRMKDVKTKRVFYSKSMNRGIAFVTFENLSEGISQKAEQYNGKTLKDRELTVDIAATKPERPHNEEESAQAQDEVAAQ